MENNPDLKKMVLMAVYGQLFMELTEELSDYPGIYKHELKQRGKLFVSSLNDYLSKIYGARMKGHERMQGAGGEDIGSVDEIQSEFWQLVNAMEKENKEAISKIIL